MQRGIWRVSAEVRALYIGCVPCGGAFYTVDRWSASISGGPQSPFLSLWRACFRAGSYRGILERYSACCYLFPCAEDLEFSSRLNQRKGPFGGRMPQLYGSCGLYLPLCKLAFWILWLSLMVLIAAALWEMSLPCVPKIYLIALMLVATFLNGSSYSLCCAYVWFLNEVSKDPELGLYPHNRFCPVSSPEYRRLVEISQGNTMMFLFVTFQFSVAMFIDGVLIAAVGGMVFIQALCFVAVLVVGLVTFVVLFQCSQIFLHKVLERWQEQSLYSILRRHQQQDAAECDVVAFAQYATANLAAYETVTKSNKMGKVDFFNIVLAVLSLLVNVATFFTSLT